MHSARGCGSPLCSQHPHPAAYPPRPPHLHCYAVLVHGEQLAHGVRTARGQHDGQGGAVAGEGAVGDEVVGHVLAAQLLGGLAVRQGIGL